MVDDGLTLDAAVRVVQLEDELAAARTRIAELERRLGDDGGDGAGAA
jgi:hypothetical protein